MTIEIQLEFAFQALKQTLDEVAGTDEIWLEFAFQALKQAKEDPVLVWWVTVRICLLGFETEPNLAQSSNKTGQNLPFRL